MDNIDASTVVWAVLLVALSILLLAMVLHYEVLLEIWREIQDRIYDIDWGLVDFVSYVLLAMLVIFLLSSFYRAPTQSTSQQSPPSIRGIN